MILNSIQTFTIILMVTVGTMVTRFLPFILFKGEKANSSYINYLGEVLPYSAIGLLLVYCLKEISFKNYPRGIPEIISVIFIALIHSWKENTLLSIGLGTALYMILVQFVFS